MLIARFREFLHCCLALALLLPYFSPDAGAMFPKDPLSGLSSCPYGSSVLDRQINQPDELLLTCKNRDEEPFAGSGGPDRIGSKDTAGRANGIADNIIVPGTTGSRTCLWYSPLLPIPPPRS